MAEPFDYKGRPWWEEHNIEEEIPEDILSKTKRIISSKTLPGTPISDVIDVVNWWWEHSGRSINHPILRHGAKSLSFLLDVDKENIIWTSAEAERKLERKLEEAKEEASKKKLEEV